ncbi:uncharacterized protein LOC134724715 isoform X3 [Mytilus trossulus]|uniref:uncharacterized protein LOC134724715 isoform X3 n=1 Tax=Mytilus trossulus TaxID=6551 RepID=UPI003007A3A3
MMKIFILHFVCWFMRRNCLTLALSDHITNSPSSMPDDSEKEINKYLCQGETLNITCPYNFFIVFDDANFGRGHSDSQRCRQLLGRENTNCDHRKQTLEVLNDKCHDQQQCILLVNKNIFGNSCWGVTKYLNVKYHCRRKVKNELTIVGIVLGVVLALIFLLIGALLFKRLRQSKQQKGTARTEEIEMNVESENQNHYDYSEVNAQSMGNNANQTFNVPIGLHQAENEYEVSTHVPSRTESEPLTYDVHMSDNTYNVTETSGNQPKDDVNNTYDHFVGEQTEDQYDIAENKVMAATKCKTNEDLYS